MVIVDRGRAFDFLLTSAVERSRRQLPRSLRSTTCVASCSGSLAGRAPARLELEKIGALPIDDAKLSAHPRLIGLAAGPQGS
jgi:hypothetical protein